MGELDYQMALLLQHKFEEESKRSRIHEETDQEFAQTLQQQFEHEANVEAPSTSLVYKKPMHTNPTKCLTDPSWELVDPTPDIHILFMAFNEKFFWNKLLAVCVSWSKKMMSCAGVCSYQGRAGMCSITLSEPLLKLRPRKDLVETLLHEMIHAFLFVTNNNRDRDGHGPEFHKHMYRINQESGTNISVYHDFHDEVRLYQQHWWRCDGPCQHRRPYFGMVRRSCNRAPGPNDRWWSEHTRNCGGKFIKVNEPEKKPNKKSSTTKTNIKNNNNNKNMPTETTKTNIKNNNNKNIPTETTKTKSNNDIRNYIPVSKDQNNSTSISSNIKGFKDLSNSQVKGKFNSTSTIVVTKTKTSTTTQNSESPSYKPTIFNDNNQNKVESKSKDSRDTDNCTNDFLSVRNHWQNKFGGEPKKRLSNESSEQRPKVPKTTPNTSPSTSKSHNIMETAATTLTIEDLVECPVCSKKLEISKLNDHLDVCLTESGKSSPVDDIKSCPICKSKIPSTAFDVHVEKCLLMIYDAVEETLDSNTNNQNQVSGSDELISCLACDKMILKADLNSHLEDCMNMSNIFEGDLVEDKNEENEPQHEESGKKYNCPFCLKLFTEDDMKAHIDDCLDVRDCFDDC